MIINLAASMSGSPSELSALDVKLVAVAHFDEEAVLLVPVAERAGHCGRQRGSRGGRLRRVRVAQRHVYGIADFIHCRGGTEGMRSVGKRSQVNRAGFVVHRNVLKAGSSARACAFNVAPCVVITACVKALLLHDVCVTALFAWKHWDTFALPTVTATAFAGKRPPSNIEPASG
eukprot:CAMPEP_0178985612 /NCGR_PEP_ID=MMETSP0795-20121207/2246_1 /TAXON_ID=88552 /ORGANISM="Amoebophrya sp., Strain Ameob2" /LENGTH=173 /DNA_ID=CAMNT_0020676583 /DNA_START=2525 /DNA_END=3048 /DNA_ORIENTATION=+